MEHFLKLWREPIEPATSFVDAEYFEEHSATFKLIDGTFRDVLFGYSSDDDNEDERNPYNTSKKKNLKPGKRKLQMNKPKLSEQCGKRGFVPCYVDERKMKYPKFSVLNDKQQAHVVYLMEKYKNCYPKFPTQVEKTELQKLEELLNRVSNERIAFDNFTKSNCGRNCDLYTFIKPEVKKYIGELWKHKILQMSRYPTCYESQTLLPLVYPVTKVRIELCMKQVLLQMGTAPIVRIPSLRKPILVGTSYAKMCAIHPPDNSMPNGNSTSTVHMPVSQDQNAEKLAKMHNADVVISLSGLKKIMNNLRPFNKEWDLPVSVKEYTTEEHGKTTKSKVVYIDKALAPFHVTTVEHNLWFYKTAVKNILNKGKNYKNISNEDCNSCPFLSIPSHQGKSETETTDMESSDSDVDINLTDKSSANVMSTELDEENALSFQTTLNSEKYAKASIQQPCTENVKQRTFFEYNDEFQDSDDEDDDRLIIDCSDSEVFCIKKQKHERDHRTFTDISNNEATCLLAKKFAMEKYKQNLYNRDSEKDSENRMVMDWSISDEFSGQGIKSHAIKEGTLHQQASNELNSSKNGNNGKIMSYQNLEQPFDNSVMEGGDIQKKTAFIQNTKETKNNSNMKKNKDKNVSKDQFSSLPDGKNATYRLWELKPEENSMKSQKYNFIKGEHPCRSFKVLVRTKVDGFEDEKSVEEEQTVRVIPKLEYQCGFGAECLTQDELFAQWAITLFNPETKILRVRLDPIRSEVMMFESVSSQEALQQLGASSRSFLSTLYSILQGLIGLNPGNYLLSHNKKMGTFATLRRAELQGRYNLQSLYSFDPSATPSYENYPWNPIDRNIITPFQRAYNRVPATFPPVSEIAMKTKKKIKRKNRKRNKKSKLE